LDQFLLRAPVWKPWESPPVSLVLIFAKSVSSSQTAFSSISWP